MEKLLNEENDWDQVQDISHTTCGKKEGTMCKIAAHEVSSALEKMKIGKASGLFGVIAEIMKVEKEFGNLE